MLIQPERKAEYNRRYRAKHPEADERWNQKRRAIYVRKRPIRTPEERRLIKAERMRRARAANPAKHRARDRIANLSPARLEGRRRRARLRYAAMRERLAGWRAKRVGLTERGGRLATIEHILARKVRIRTSSQRKLARLARYADQRATRTGAIAVIYEHCAWIKCQRLFVHRASVTMHFCSAGCAKRAGKRSLQIKGASVREIAIRDGWHCHVCHKKVPDRAYHARDLDATRDHLIPVTAGGTDHPSNLALAHNKCNWDRGAGGIAQLRLIA